MSGKPVKIGVVGVRNIGRNHIKSATKTEDVKVVAVADTDTSRLEECRNQFGDLRCYTDASELFADDGVDGVVLALPNNLHAKLTIAALRAGKHVLVEKPISRTAAEAREMIAAREETSRILMVGMNQRFEAPHRAIKKQLESGAIGNIYYCRTRWLMQYPLSGLWERGDWFLTREGGGGGPLLDLGVHRLDLALHMMDFPEVASVDGTVFNILGPAAGKKHGKDYAIEDGGVALVRFKNGAALVLEASYLINLPFHNMRHTDLAGERGYAVLGEDVHIGRVTAEGDKAIDLPEDTTGAASCVEHFGRVIQGKEKLSPTAEQALTSMEILEALYESADTGKTVYF